MPIPKTKLAPASSAPANTSATKPDKKVYDAEQEKIKAEIDALQTQLNTARDKVALATRGGSANERRTALRAELDELFNQQAGGRPSRAKIWDQVKALDEGVKQKIKDLQIAKAKAPFKTVEDVDTHVKNLEAKVESGTMKLADEKRALQEISQLKRTRRQVESFQAQQDSIEADRASADEHRKQLNDPAVQVLSERINTIKAELSEIKKSEDEAYASRNKLIADRDAIQAKVNELWTQKKESSQQYREANDRHWARVNEDRARRVERLKAQRAEEEAEKRRQAAQRIREEAEVPAFQAQIEDCQTLIDFFSGKTTGNVTLKMAPSETPKEGLAGVPKLELRQVNAPTDLVARKKKGEEEESYFVGGKGKKARKAKPSETNGSTSTSNQLNVPLPTLTALLSLSIPPPGSATEVPRVIEDLKTKKAWFEANQVRVTTENIAKAEAEVKRLDNSSKTDSAATNGHEVSSSDVTGPNAGGEKPAEPAHTPQTAEAVSTAPPSEVVTEKLEAVQEDSAAPH